MTVFNTGPVLVSLAAFGVYAAMGRPLTAAVAFPSLALFNLLRWVRARARVCVCVCVFVCVCAREWVRGRADRRAMICRRVWGAVARIRQVQTPGSHTGSVGAREHVALPQPPGELHTPLHLA
jgi:hypothetical protein